MFADVEADIYILIDGDHTYDTKNLDRLVKKLLSENLDMVIGRRIEQDLHAYRFGHRFGIRFGSDSIEYAAMVTAILFPFMSGLAVIITALLGHHVGLISRNQTQLEYKRRSREYDKGSWRENFSAVFF